MSNTIEKQAGDTLTINVSDFNQLAVANQFSKVPLTIVDYFHDLDISIDGKATVLKHHKKTEWYIIEKTAPFWTFFHLKVGKRSRNKFPLQIARETPDFNLSKSDPRTRNGISFQEDELLIDRDALFETDTLLGGKQQQKADYFFKIEGSQSPLKHERAIYKLAEWSDEAYSKLNFSIAKVGAFALVSLLVLVSVSSFWKLAILLIGFVGYYFFKDMFIEFWGLYNRNSALSEAIKVLEKERSLLAVDKGPTMVSDQQMETWLEEEIKAIDKEALRHFQWTKEAIIPYDQSLKSRSTVGLNIEEWGLLQPIYKKGKTTISPKHLRAFRFNGSEPLYGVYYLVLFYFTEEAVGIYSCFYDFIRSEKIQPVAHKYSYQELAKIEATIDGSKIEEGIGLLETQKIILQFYNKDSLPIALSDELAITNLKNKIAGIRPESGDTTPTVPIKNLELKNYFQLPANQLEGHRTNLILNSVHHFWNQRKHQSVPVYTQPLPPVQSKSKRTFRYV